MGSAEGLTERSSRSTVHPTDACPRAQSATLIPGSNLQVAAGTPPVNMAAPAPSLFTHTGWKLYRFLLTGCLMKHESVKLEKQILIEGEESKCYSVEPVLRCLPGCMPVRTTQVEVGFHCVPAGQSAETQTHTHTHTTKSILINAVLSLGFCRYQHEPFDYERHVRKEHRRDGNSRSSPGLPLRCSVFLISSRVFQYGTNCFHP